MPREALRITGISKLAAARGLFCPWSFVMDSGDAMLRAVRNHSGIAVLPAYMTARHIRASALVTILDSSVMEDYPIHAFALPSRHTIPKIKVFLEFLQSPYGETPYWDALDEPPTAVALRASI